MQLASFIQANIEHILQAWEEFASSINSANDLNKSGLRDHAKKMLMDIVTDLGTHQTKREQSDKSKGIESTNNKKKASVDHGIERLEAGFSIDETVSEFRALRASVIALWVKSNCDFQQTDIQDITRFNEAIDQAVTESIISYSRQKELQSRLFGTVLSASSDQIFIFDIERKFTYANKAGLDVYETSREMIIGKTYPDLRFTFAKEIHQWLKKVIHTEKIVSGEIVHPSKAGNKRVFEYIFSPVMNKNAQVEAVVGISRDITERKASEELSWHKANYDELTGLPNRRLFQDRLKQDIKHAERTALPIVLMFIDLDHFKEVNDEHGHDAGDDLLQQVSKRINACIRKADTVARLGGDEFTVILTEIDGVEQIKSLSQKIVKQLAKPFKLKDKTAKISCSIGVAYYPKDGSSSEQLIKNADKAMYKAKGAGRNQVSFFRQSK
ncbi:diguanylate cyclase [Methylotenera sp.]|uniref:diguanylate cyclase domain-containing protein n=1 Tax=Methylotenera sp. TaxID=2051956 RepID=UPI002489E7F1|nr:diguanylate cyclase [Methylotenera sp.]MDI1298487.1 diguanylate cyclase [Methylotenera sp.]